MPSDDRQPLLPTHVNNNASHRLSTTKISFPSSTTSAFGSGDSDATLLDEGSGRTSGKYRITGGNRGGGSVAQRKDGLPKFSRECLWSEIKCYGSYILPTFFIFGVLVIGIALIVVGKKKGWF